VASEELVVPVTIYELNAAHLPVDILSKINAIWSQAGIQFRTVETGHIRTSHWPMVATEATLRQSMENLVGMIWNTATSAAHGPVAACLIFASWSGSPNGQSHFSDDLHVSYVRHTQEPDSPPLARVTSHELGHRFLGGNEAHVADPDNLMSEGQNGTKLSDSQVKTAREWSANWLANN